MIKIILIITFLIFTLQADIIGFYKSAIVNLQYNKTYSLYKRSATLSQDAIFDSQYANFNINTSYIYTKAKTLKNHFNTSNISLNDKIDLFNKKSYLIKAITFGVKVKKFLLDSKKEQLFNALVSMISLYHATNKKIILNKKLYGEQSFIYKKLYILQLHGAISTLDLLRFKNLLTTSQTKIIRQENELLKMKKQLNLYAPNQPIPHLNSHIKYSKKQFLLQNPSLKVNEAMTDKLIAQANAYSHNYLPKLTIGIAYQKVNDPTANGNNFDFNIALHIPLNSGNFRKAEALKVSALNQESKNTVFKLQREKEYIILYQNYKNAQEQLLVLKANLVDYKQSKKIVKTAFLKQFIDFNNYLQVLTQTLYIQEKIINLRSQVNLNVTLINYIASGVIYE